MHKYWLRLCLCTSVDEGVCVLSHARAFMQVSMDRCDIGLQVCKCVGTDVCGYVLLCVHIAVHERASASAHPWM